MSNDDLAKVLTLDPEELARQGIENAERRAMIYMDDLREVLSTPAGIRVIHYFIAQTGMNGQTYANDNRVYANAALADYGKHRMQEICAADPAAAIRLMIEGVKPSTKGDDSDA